MGASSPDLSGESYSKFYAAASGRNSPFPSANTPANVKRYFDYGCRFWDIGVRRLVAALGT